MAKRGLARTGQLEAELLWAKGPNHGDSTWEEVNVLDRALLDLAEATPPPKGEFLAC